MAKLYPTILSSLVCVCVGMADAGLAQVTEPRPENGRLMQTTTARRATVTVTVTDKEAKVIPTERFPRSFEFGTDSEPSIRIPIPAIVNRSDNGEAANVIDVTKTTRIEEQSPQGGGQASDLMIEAMVFDVGTSQFVLGNIFGTIAGEVGFGQVIIVPELFADTTGDGIIGEGDLLYSLVDLNLYLDGPPSFSLGDTFDISAGLVAGLPGMMFSTAPFVFDPASGFSGVPFTGVGVADAQVGLSAIPEPSTWLMTIGGFGMVLGARGVGARRARDPRSSASSAAGLGLAT